MEQTLTDKRCRSKVRTLDSILCASYAKANVRPGAAFWQRLDEIDIELGRALAMRPITNMEIDAACNKARAAFSSLLRDEQARAAAAQGRSGTR